MVSCSLLKISAHFRSLYFLAWAFRVLRGKCIRPRERKVAHILSLYFVFNEVSALFVQVISLAYAYTLIN